MTRTVPAARPVFSDEDRSTICQMVDHALATGALTLGTNTRELEEAFAARHHMPFAVAVSSGTAALQIALRTFGVDGGEVVVPANTFFATAAAVVHAGGIPCFADISHETLALSAETIEAVLSERTVGVVLVHIGGLVSPDTPRIRDLCRQRGVLLLEDAAHAHGSGYDGEPAGTFGDAAAFSFYPTKVMTSGEGGILLTRDEQARDEARIYRDQGKSSFLGGDHVRLGDAWRMSEVHAAIGLVQLRRLDEFIATRRAVAACYDELLAGAPGITPLAMPFGCEPNYYKYVAMLDASVDRDELKRALRAEYDVALSGEVYATPLDAQPVFAKYAHGVRPVAEDVCARHVCLPIHSDMTADEAEYVATSLRSALSRLTQRTRATSA